MRKILFLTFATFSLMTQSNPYGSKGPIGSSGSKASPLHKDDNGKPKTKVVDVNYECSWFGCKYEWTVMASGDNQQDKVVHDELENAENLTVYVSSKTDMKQFANLKKLKSLHLCHWGDASSPFEMLYHWILGQPIIDFSSFADPSTITNLHIQRVELNRLNGLEFLTNVAEVTISDVSNADLRPLSVLKNLKKLTLDSSDVSDVQPLIGLESLETIELKGGSVIYGSANLVPMQQLHFISLENSAITDSGIGVNDYRELGVLFNKLQQAMPQCKFSGVSGIFGKAGEPGWTLHELEMTEKGYEVNGRCR